MSAPSNLTTIIKLDSDVVRRSLAIITAFALSLTIIAPRGYFQSFMPLYIFFALAGIAFGFHLGVSAAHRAWEAHIGHRDGMTHGKWLSETANGNTFTKGVPLHITLDVLMGLTAGVVLATVFVFILDLIAF